MSLSTVEEVTFKIHARTIHSNMNTASMATNCSNLLCIFYPMKKYYLESRSRGIFYMKYVNRR
jgi:hypothetical protein